MNGTRTATDPMEPGLKRKLPDDSNPMLAAATKRMKKEVGVLHILAVYSPSSTLQANSGASKRKRAQITSAVASIKVLTGHIQTSGKSSRGVSSSFVHPYNAPYRLLIHPHHCPRQPPTPLPDPRLPTHNHSPQPPNPSHPDRRNLH
jgi:hypothetical protein